MAATIKQRIIDKLHQAGGALVAGDTPLSASLADELGVSRAHLGVELRKLELDGAITRTWGRGKGWGPTRIDLAQGAPAAEQQKLPAPEQETQGMTNPNVEALREHAAEVLTDLRDHADARKQRSLSLSRDQLETTEGQVLAAWCWRYMLDHADVQTDGRKLGPPLIHALAALDVEVDRDRLSKLRGVLGEVLEAHDLIDRPHTRSARWFVLEPPPQDSYVAEAEEATTGTDLVAAGDRDQVDTLVAQLGDRLPGLGERLTVTGLVVNGQGINMTALRGDGRTVQLTIN